MTGAGWTRGRCFAWLDSFQSRNVNGPTALFSHAEVAEFSKGFQMSFPDLEAVTRSAESEWAASADVRAEFAGDKKAFVALRRAEARGLCRVQAPAAAKRTTAASLAPVLPPADALAAYRSEGLGLANAANLARVRAPLDMTSADGEWERSPQIQAEFGGDKSAYLALRRAEAGNRVKVFTPGASTLQS